jgi:hypothetical protein
MSFLAFLGEINKRADAGPPFRRRPDMLNYALQLVHASPRSLQSRTLAKFIVAHCSVQGTCRPAELFALDAEHTDLAADLADVRLSGLIPKEQWEAARLQLSMVLDPDAPFGN